MKCKCSGGRSSLAITTGVPLQPTWQRAPCTILARRTVKGTKEDKPKAPKAQSASGSSNNRPSKQPKGPNGKPRSAIEEFVRNTPVLNRFADGTLLLGDMVMIAATEVSSERIPYESMSMLTGVSMFTWLAAAAILGDYKGNPPTTDNWYLSLLGPSFLAVVDSTLTWALSAVLSITIFSVLVSSNLLDPAPMMDDLGTDNLSPQLEVAVAGLITMACWRGIAARLRYT